MNEYMRKTARKDAQQNNAAPIQAKTNGIPNSVLNDVFAGRRKADSSMMGHSQNLAPSIAAKMSRAFGMDLTGMQVYQSDAMKGTGMRGMAQGNKIVLSSEVNLNTTAGQAVLGHEISHIHAQSQGVGMGHSGLYENAALEHQADTEGLLAAQGRSIYQSGGMDTGIGMQYGLGMQGVEGMTAIGGGMSAGAGAPMQANKLTDLFSGKKSEEPQKIDYTPAEYLTNYVPPEERLEKMRSNGDVESNKNTWAMMEQYIKNVTKKKRVRIQEKYEKGGEFGGKIIPETIPIPESEDEELDEQGGSINLGSMNPGAVNAGPKNVEVNGLRRVNTIRRPIKSEKQEYKVLGGKTGKTTGSAHDFRKKRAEIGLNEELAEKGRETLKKSILDGLYLDNPEMQRPESYFINKKVPSAQDKAQPNTGILDPYLLRFEDDKATMSSAELYQKYVIEADKNKQPVKQPVQQVQPEQQVQQPVQPEQQVQPDKEVPEGFHSYEELMYNIDQRQITGQNLVGGDKRKEAALAKAMKKIKDEAKEKTKGGLVSEEDFDAFFAKAVRAVKAIVDEDDDEEDNLDDMDQELAELPEEDEPKENKREGCEPYSKLEAYFDNAYYEASLKWGNDYEAKELAVEKIQKVKEKAKGKTEDGWIRNEDYDRACLELQKELEQIADNSKWKR